MADHAIPLCETDIADAVADAMRDGAKLAITGGGSKAPKIKPQALLGLKNGRGF